MLDTAKINEYESNEPIYKIWVEQKFTEYIIKNKEIYLNVRYSKDSTVEEVKEAEKLFVQYSHDLESLAKENAVNLQVEEEKILDCISFWRGAYKHGQLDVLDDILSPYRTDL